MIPNVPPSTTFPSGCSANEFTVPLAPDATLFDLANGWHIDSLGGYLKALPAQVYLALKPLILWVPVGMLYAALRPR